jgi:DNA-binding Lrp family transcriptional regulator
MGIGFMRIKVSKGRVDEAFQELLQTPNVIVCIKILGQADIIALAPFKNFDELNDLKEQISKMPNVCEVRLRIEKAYSRWPVNRISELIAEKL